MRFYTTVMCKNEYVKTRSISQILNAKSIIFCVVRSTWELPTQIFSCLYMFNAKMGLEE